MAQSVSWSEPPALIRYGVTGVAVALATVASLLLQQHLDIQPVVSLFLCAVLFAAWFGGLGPGLLAIALSALAFDYYFVPPRYSLFISSNDALRLALFLVTALFVAVLSARQRSTTHSLRRARDDLQAAVEELERVNASLQAENAERRRAEAKLRGAEGELQQTIDMIPAVVTCYRPDGERYFVNKTWQDYLGLTLSDIEGERWRSIIHPEDQEESDRRWQLSLATGEPFEFQHRVRRADGEWRWHLVRRVPLRDPAGAVIRWYSIAFDIEDQKRAQAALRASEARLASAERELQTMIDCIPTNVARYRSDGSPEFVNQHWRTYTGLGQESLQGQRWAAAVHPDDLPTLEAVWRAHLATGEPFETIQRLRRADGEYRWFLVRRVPLRDENGEVIRWYAASHDIDDQKRMEQALRRNEAELVEAKRALELTIDTIPVLASRYRTDGTTDFVNQTWRTYTGLSQESWPRRGSAVVHPDDRPRVEQAWVAHLATAEPFEVEQRMRRADGEYRWYVVRRVPLRDDDGNVIAWYGAGHDIDDQKRLEQALRKSEAELSEAKRSLQQTIDTIPILVVSYEADGRRDFVNAAWKHYTGLWEENVRGTDWSIIVHPEDIPKANRRWHDALAKGEPLHIELRLRRADGQYRWHAVDRVALRDEKGEVTKWYSVASDIEERKRAELALRESEAHLAEAQHELQLTLDLIPTFAWQTRADGYAEYLNKRWLDFTGLPIERALGWEWQVAVHPDDLSGLLERWHKMLATGQGEEVEARMRRHDGEYRWFLFRPAPLRDDSGKVVRWYGTNTDIEDRRRAEQALRRSEAHLNEAQRLSLTGSFGWRVSGDDVVWSKEMYRIFDLDPSVEATVDIVLGRTHPDDIEPLRQFIRRMGTEDGDLEFEHRLALPDGTLKHVHMRTHRMQFDTGEPEVVGALMDVTAARNAEAALRRSQAELAHASRVATLGELSTSIAHEVNQPLTAIATSGEAAIRWLDRETPDKDHAVRAITRMVKQAQRASEVIRGIRHLSKKAEPQMSQIDVNSLAEEAVMLVRGEAAGQRVAVRPRLWPELPPVRGDRIQLQQVLINLVMNGIQAMTSVTERPRVLTIRTEPRSDSEVLIAVEDAGVGVEAESVDRLFSPFYSTKPDGMGMGLSICRSIVEAHGGTIWAAPNTGPGMTFQFTLSVDREGNPAKESDNLAGETIA